MSTCTTPGHEDRHRPEHAFICGGCVRKLEEDLDEATWLWDQLTITLTRQDVIGGDGGRRSAETSLAFKPGASEAMWVLAETLGAAAGELAAALGMQYPLNPVRWLKANVDRLAGVAEAGRLVDEIRSATWLARATVDRPAAMVLCGRCPSMVDAAQCTGVLYARPKDADRVADEFAVCPECGASHEVKERLDHMINAVAVLNVTKATALVWIKVLMDRQIPDGTWRQWRSRGRLHVYAVSVEGQELFRFGDVRDLAINWMSRKKAA